MTIEREQPDIAERCLHHADMILRASGSGLRHYTMAATRNAILSAMIDAYEEAYRAGAKRAEDFRARAAIALASSDGKGEGQ